MCGPQGPWRGCSAVDKVSGSLLIEGYLEVNVWRQPLTTRSKYLSSSSISSWVHMVSAIAARRIDANYFKPSFFPAASSEIDSRMRRARVSGCFAI